MGIYVPLGIARCGLVEPPWDVFPCGVEFVLEAVDVPRFDHFLWEFIPGVCSAIVE